ncbi:hypothetical protein SSPIM334S_07241 [Streptomyces spiroverticillatus]|nr:hypothetical protein [Streptomyces finlayi]
MITSPHQASHRIFPERPGLLAPVFRLLGVQVPERASVEVLDPEAIRLGPLRSRTDTVLRVVPADGGPFLLAIDVQGRREPEKERSWRYCLGHLESQFRMPVLLLVLCRDRATAAWAAGPLPAEGALTVRPLVLGPDEAPVLPGYFEARRNPFLAALAAVVHGNGSEGSEVLHALEFALREGDVAGRLYCAELTEVGLAGTPARTEWRKLQGAEG